MSEPLCLVTGASSGLGKALAIGLARRGATVILVARDQAKGQAAVDAARAAAPNAQLELLLADLSLQDDVHELADRVQVKHNKLDVLINNAAVFKASRTLTPDGVETMFAVNHLAPFVLTQLLLPQLQASGAGRVLNITAPSVNKLDFENLQGEKNFSALNAFGATKMANLMFTFKAARRFATHQVVVNAVHPGLVKSNLMQEAPAPIRWLSSVTAASPERASRSIMRLALDPEFATPTGQFYKNAKPIKADAYAYDEVLQQKLWLFSDRLVDLD